MNPTSEIIKTLIETYIYDNIEYSILEVSLEGVDSFHKILKNAIALDEAKDRIFIHLGVSGEAKCFHLEEYAYNNKNFRVPDENGNQPINCNISANDLNIDASLKTSLDVTSLKTELESLGHSALISDDPGRFLCNYIHYQSLSLCSSLQNLNMNHSTSLFVHVPPIETVPLEKQIEFVKDLLQLISCAML